MPHETVRIRATRHSSHRWIVTVFIDQSIAAIVEARTCKDGARCAVKQYRERRSTIRAARRWNP